MSTFLRRRVFPIVGDDGTLGIRRGRTTRFKSARRTGESDFVHLITFDAAKVTTFQESFDTHAAAEAFR